MSEKLMTAVASVRTRTNFVFTPVPGIIRSSIVASLFWWTLVFTPLSPAVLQWEKATVLLCAPGGCAAPLSLDLPPMSPGATYSSTVGGLTPEGGAITIAVNSCAVTGVTGAKSK